MNTSVMNTIVRAVLLSTAVALGLSIIPVAALTGSFLATHAVSAAMHKADPLTLAVAPKPEMGDFAVNTPIRTAAR